MSETTTALRWILTIALILMAACGLFVLGLSVGSGTPDVSANAPDTETASAETKAQYACSMFCVPPLDDPGKCPICGMDMVEVGATSRRLTLSAEARRLAQVRVARARRMFVTKSLRFVGKVAMDEAERHRIVAPMDGRVTQLNVGFAGISVRAGDPMLEFSSDRLLAMQRELVDARRAWQGAAPKDKRPLLEALIAQRRKLIELGMDGRDALALEKSGKATGRIVLRAPKSARVMQTHTAEGAFLEVGEPIYTMGRIGGLWVMLDAYESDLPWLRLGQEVEFELEARPGKIIVGKIAFISPVIDPVTRTAKVRVSAEVRLGNSIRLVPNRGGMMKVGMFVRARVLAQIGADGLVFSPSEIEDIDEPLVIPASAPLVTGKRAVVYVAEQGSEGTYEGREIVLGPRADDYYVVLAGLNEDERVVVNGAFKIDSAIQIRGGPSMMNPEQEAVDDSPHPQARCPVMGREIRKDLMSDYAGRRVYFCCEQCIPIFATDPKTYVNQMERDGVILARTPSTQSICPICGQDVVEDAYADHDGKRIFFCSAACVKRFEADPETVVAQLTQRGIVLPDAPKPQTICPIMGKPIVKDVYTDYEGQRVYFCCPPCIPRFLEEPQKHLDAMKAQFVVLEKSPAAATTPDAGK